MSPEHRLVKILLVEDNPDDAFLAMEVLRDARFANEVVHVADGEAALAALRERPERELPDLVLLDLNLPGKHGREVLAELKADPELRRIPVVVLTTSAAEEDVIAAYNLHANAYIRKPVGFAGLVEAVQALENFWIGIVTLPGRR